MMKKQVFITQLQRIELRRLLSVLLTVVLLLALFPVLPADAAAEVWDGTVDISWYDSAQDVFYLDTPAKLAGLAALVNGMTDPTCPNIIGDKSLLQSIAVSDYTLVGAGGGNVSDTVYISNTDFSYKTVYLTADMDMGGRYDASSDTWSGPNWTPIGGKFPMLPHEAVGDCLTLDTRFNGVLDGQGHSISNLYCDRYADKGFPYSMAIGLVGYLGGIGGQSSDDTITFTDGWQPAVRNLAVTSGCILGRRMVGGIVGRVDETSNGVVIENCASFARVHSTDAKGVGGIVGSGWGKGVIRGCYNAGAISTVFSSPAGGIVGTNGGMDIYCCYNVGKIDTNGQSHGRAIGSHDTGTYTVNYCLFLNGTGDDEINPGYYGGSSKRIRVAVTGMDAEQLKSREALSALNTDGEIFVEDINGINGGYPVLWFQNGSRQSVCTVSVRQTEEGTVTADRAGQVAFGQTIQLSCTPSAEYTLAYYTVNGRQINSDRFTVTENAEIAAVFKKLRHVKLTLPESLDYYVAVTCNGSQLLSGDTVTEEDVLTVLLYGYSDAVPQNMDLEYINAYELTLTGTKKNTDGTYTVTGEADVNVSVNREVQNKTWINLTDTEWYDQYPRQSTYTLTNARQLAGLAELVNTRGIHFEGVTILLGNDISLQNTDGTVGTRYWTPIGSNANKYFGGIFDGQGYAIYNLKIHSASSYSALFGCCKNAEIKNLSVYGVVENTASTAYASGIAAWMSGGGIKNCTGFVTVTAKGTQTGGIAAMIRDGAVVENCFNCGAVTAASGVGGIVGVSDSGDDAIVSCANFAAVTSTGNYTYGTGGIIGRLAGSLTACVNEGTVSGTDRYIGGLAGYATTKNYSSILDCANRADVSSSNTMSTAALGGLVGYAQYLKLGNGENTGTVTPKTGFKSENVGETIGRTGTNPIKELSSAAEIPSFTAPAERLFVEENNQTHTVTFIADGVEVAQYPYSTDTKTVDAPAVPQKDGYAGYWAPFELGDCDVDITVRAIYRQELILGGETITEDGTYFIAWFSTGTITVAKGVQAKLNGSDGGEDGFDGLQLLVEKKAGLTLESTVLNGEGTLVTFSGDNTLTLSGTNRLVSRAEMENNPTISAKNLTINGDGTLYANGALKNPAIFIAPNSRVDLVGGTVCLSKDTLLGKTGGVFYANGAEITVSGGTLRCYTASDNVAAVSADKVTLTSGTLLAQAKGSPVAVQADVSATGGTISVSGNTGNYTTDNIAYRGADACTSYSGSVGFTDFLPFDDVPVAAAWYDAVCWCYENGIFNGVASDSFAPDSSMTRAMFVTVLYRMAGCPKTESDTAFTDLTQDWYRNAVSWAVQNGITKGTSDTTFSPNLPVTKEQTAVFLYRYALAQGEIERLGSLGISSTVGAVSDWASDECLWATDRGLFAGTPKALAEPGSDAPRSMLAETLFAYHNLVQ